MNGGPQYPHGPVQQTAPWVAMRQGHERVCHCNDHDTTSMISPTIILAVRRINEYNNVIKNWQLPSLWIHSSLTPFWKERLNWMSSSSSWPNHCKFANQTYSAIQPPSSWCVTTNRQSSHVIFVPAIGVTLLVLKRCSRSSFLWSFSMHHSWQPLR